MQTMKKNILIVLGGLLLVNLPVGAVAGKDAEQTIPSRTRSQLLATNSCPGCDLAGVNLDRANLAGANLEGANLSGARLHLTALAKANLRNADLRGAAFGGADLAGADLRGTKLKGATFVGAYLVGVKVDKNVVLNQTVEELVAEDSQQTDDTVEKKSDVVPAGTVVHQVAEKNGAPSNGELQKQPAPATPVQATPPSEPGFFDRTIAGVKGMFGQDEQVQKKDAAKKTAPVAQPVVEKQEAVPVVADVPEKSIAATSAPALEQGQHPSASTGKETTAPSPEPGFFDRTVAGVKGMFGQDEQVQKKDVAKKPAPVAQPVVEKQEAVPVVADVPEKSIAATPAPAPEQGQHPSASTGKETTAPSPEPGFFDRTVAGVKGMFGQDEQVQKKDAAKQPAPVAQPVVEKQEAMPVVADVPEKSIAATSALALEQGQHSSASTGKETTAPSPEPGFFDRTVAGVKGLFGKDEQVEKQNEKKSAVMAPEPPKPPTQVVEQTITKEDVSAASVAKTSDVTSAAGKKQQTSGVAGGGAEEPGSVAEIRKNMERLLDTKRCYGCNLAGVDLSGKNLDGVDLEGADLTSSRLDGSDLENANLKGAKLVGSNLKNADLQGADLYKANLSGADVTGANMKDALMDDAQLTGVVGLEHKEGT